MDNVANSCTILGELFHSTFWQKIRDIKTKCFVNFSIEVSCYLAKYLLPKRQDLFIVHCNQKSLFSKNVIAEPYQLRCVVWTHWSEKIDLNHNNAERPFYFGLLCRFLGLENPMVTFSVWIPLFSSLITVSRFCGLSLAPNGIYI